MPSVSLTDHGSMAGAVQLWKATRGTGVKPVIGCEVYVADDRKAHEKGNAHLTLLAADNAGYSNLIKLSIARLPRGLLLQAARRLGAARAPLAGADRALRLPLRARLQGARGEPRHRRRGRARPPRAGLRRATTSTSSCRTRTSTCRRASCRSSSQLADEAGAADRRDRRRALPPRHRRARTRGAALHPVGRLAQEPEPLEVRDRPLLLQVAARRWRSTSRARRTRCGARSRSPSAATSRSSSAGSCCRSFDVPEGRDAFDYLVELCEKGLQRRYDKVTPELPGAAPVRAEDDQGDGLHRLLPDRLGLHPLREDATASRVGPGRGSSAGSLVAYSLAITDIDPIRYDLLFERFLNPGRKSMPDIDIDFAVEGRERVINYVREKYGADRVAQIITFSTMAARAAVRDAGRVLEVPVRRRRQDREADPGRPGPDARRVPEAGRRAAQGDRRRPGREGDHRARAAARGADARRLDPRRRRRDRRRAADQRRAAAAEGRRPGGRDAVLDEATSRRSAC